MTAAPVPERPAGPRAGTGPRPFDVVLVANRGEIARRILRTLRALGIRSVAVHSEADRDAVHVREADRSVCLGPAAPARSYLRVEAVVEAALATGADAVHPGYGFLAENPALARACAAAGIVLVGPGPEAMEVMGDKIRAKTRVAASGVPVIGGVAEPGLDDGALVAAAAALEFPLLVKPSAGGGGKGMHVARTPGELPEALAAARRVAAAAFGDDTLLLEQLVEAPRHIEVQVLADAHGAVIHLGERECSLQRRHQKIIEEAPSPLLDAAARARMGEAACRVARSVGYTGAGTVEFLVPAAAPEQFFFMEMNTRLQVEHPVTEAVTGVDLVEQQLRAAAGQPLALAQEDVVLTGHAVEARVYAEDPASGFLPTAGTVLALEEAAGPGIRVDSALAEGLVVGSDYDPMLAKVIARGADRAQALDRLDAALASTVVLGVGTNTAYLRALLAEPAVRAGALDTTLVERCLPGLALPVPDEEHWTAAAAFAAAHRPPGPQGPAGDPGPWGRPDGWRPTGRARPAVHLAHGLAPPRRVAAGDGVRLGPVPGRPSAPLLEAPGRSRVVHLAATPGGDRVWVGAEGAAFALSVLSREQLLERSLAALDRAAGAAAPELHAPMPGTVVAVPVAPGERVAEGQTVVVVEAMKMEHRLTAPTAGTAEVSVRPGEQVRLHQLLARVVPDDPPGPATPPAGAPPARPDRPGA
ncbi:acetyl/propionyl-CoA carboxylase subunit alpha [Kocuria flava]|uniref:acetyl/propionyl/methylcrotonyl-CoA carboxylase subunit alpha n=1 Tax=Kocuria flava TaxID=446860 RepID=UPI001FF32F88|nr:biotin carboxylase N-terminal domain-containing protein [Kocuria flava]MCJ8504587.1 acetyl/propionyl-CoA carboxylase subunit alpha [Kocuria flava]